MERDLVIALDFAFNRISTHTLTWSVTLMKYKAVAAAVNFNSHAHVERDT